MSQAVAEKPWLCRNCSNWSCVMMDLVKSYKNAECIPKLDPIQTSSSMNDWIATYSTSPTLWSRRCWVCDTVLHSCFVLPTPARLSHCIYCCFVQGATWLLLCLTVCWRQAGPSPTGDSWKAWVNHGAGEGMWHSSDQCDKGKFSRRCWELYLHFQETEWGKNFFFFYYCYIWN